MSPNDRSHAVGRRIVGSAGPSSARSSTTAYGEPYSLFRISTRVAADSAAYRFSHAHPELRIEILGRMDLDPDHQVVELRVLGAHASRYADEVRALPDVSEVDVHSQTDRAAVYRVSLITDVPGRALRTYRVLTRYPVVLQDGWFRFETVAPASRIRQLVRHLQRSVGSARIEAVRRGPVPVGELGLTASQERVFRTALQTGYFNAPRGVSLTELARKIGRSKSTVSQQLARIQRRLAESALQLELSTLPSGLR